MIMSHSEGCARKRKRDGAGATKVKCHWAGYEDEQDRIPSADGIESSVNAEQRRVLIEIFFKTPHLDIIRQSIHRLSFESTELNQQSEFLLVSIYCLSALYI
jgi:hypothetical protein